MVLMEIIVLFILCIHIEFISANSFHIYTAPEGERYTDTANLQGLPAASARFAPLALLFYLPGKNRSPEWRSGGPAGAEGLTMGQLLGTGQNSGSEA